MSKTAKESHGGRSASAVEASKQFREMLRDFQSMTSSQQESVLLELDKHYANTTSDFFCPVLNTRITVPCNCTPCNFNVSGGTTTHNCLRKHMFDQGVDTLGVDVISELADIPEIEIKKSLDLALVKMRAYTLGVEIRTGKHNTFEYVSGVPVCVVCGALIQKKSFTVDSTNDLMYCSRQCYKKKPPTMVKLEVFYHCDIRVVLAIAKKVFRRLPVISSVLDVKRRTLLKWYEEFLGVSASVFGVDAFEFVDVMRRPTPKHAWAMDFLGNMHNKASTSVPQKALELEASIRKMCKSL
jgi:hypothetical protein